MNRIAILPKRLSPLGGEGLPPGGAAIGLNVVPSPSVRTVFGWDRTAAAGSDDIVRARQASIHARLYRQGHCLYEQGDEFAGLFHIESGLVGLRKLDENGVTMLVGLLGPGDFVGYAPLLVGGEHLTSAEVLQPSRIAFADEATARALTRKRRRLMPTVLSQAVRDLSRLQERCLQMRTEQAHIRLARLVLSLGDGAAKASRCSAARFPLPIRYKDMADLIGIRPETLSRAIARLRSMGVVDVRDLMVEVPNFDRLARIVGVGSLCHELAA